MRINLNENFGGLQGNYLFSEIAARVEEFRAKNLQNRILRLGIGDVSLPISQSACCAMARAVAEMGRADGFRGYPPSFGYDFLRRAIAKRYLSRGVSIDEDEIFVSDGAKSDLGNLCDLFGDNEILIPSPVYPVYLDSNIIAGRRVKFLVGNKENKFLPLPSKNEGTCVIYLCSPNNPTGAAYNGEGLQAWVDFAKKTGSLIIFDAAYEAFICDNLPHTIFECDGARECAIEVCSFSKMAGFTGLRCGWTTIPQKAIAALWKRRQSTKFNGVSYIVQRGAEAALSDVGMAENLKNIAYYMENAKILSQALTECGIYFVGGKNSPYIWLECPRGMKSRDFFDLLLEKCDIVGTPGAGFGESGEGFLRLSALGSRSEIIEASERMKKLLK